MDMNAMAQFTESFFENGKFMFLEATMTLIGAVIFTASILLWMLVVVVVDPRNLLLKFCHIGTVYPWR